MIGDIRTMHRRLFLTLVALAALPAGALSAEEKKKSGGGSYIQIQTLLGTTIRSTGRRGVLAVDCGLDVPNEALRTYAEQSTPRLRAAYVQIVQSYAAGLGPGALPSPDYLGLALQRQTDIILGKPGARVLLGAIVVN